MPSRSSPTNRAFALPFINRIVFILGEVGRMSMPLRAERTLGRADMGGKRSFDGSRQEGDFVE